LHGTTEPDGNKGTGTGANWRGTMGEWPKKKVPVNARNRAKRKKGGKSRKSSRTETEPGTACGGSLRGGGPTGEKKDLKREEKY